MRPRPCLMKSLQSASSRPCASLSSSPSTCAISCQMTIATMGTRKDLPGTRLQISVVRLRRRINRLAAARREGIRLADLCSRQPAMMWLFIHDSGGGLASPAGLEAPRGSIGLARFRRAERFAQHCLGPSRVAVIDSGGSFSEPCQSRTDGVHSRAAERDAPERQGQHLDDYQTPQPADGLASWVASRRGSETTASKAASFVHFA